MRYELYESYEVNTYSYICSKGSLDIIIDTMFLLRKKRGNKYVIVDNEEKFPINYHLLGLDAMPTKDKHYEIILNCKFSKHLEAKNLCSDNSIKNYNEIYNEVMRNATKETDMYFKDLYKCKNI